MAKNTKKTQRKADAKRAGTRTRNWTAIFYPEDLPDDWRELVDSLQVRWVESPLHNEDFDDDGRPKKAHHHVMFMFGSVITLEKFMGYLAELFGTSDGGSVIGVAEGRKVADRTGLVRYFAHLDHPHKAQYDVKDIVGHNGADVEDLLRYSATETREMIIEMEEYIENHNITELSDFSAAIRYDHPEWHTIVSTKMTFYFNAFIRSRRHKMETEKREISVLQRVDLDTGEIVEEGDPDEE